MSWSRGQAQVWMPQSHTFIGQAKEAWMGKGEKKRLIATFSIVHHKSWVDSGETMHLATEHCTSVAAC